MRKITLLFASIIISCSIFAQQEAMFTNYMFNTQAVNPAYAGSLNALSVTTLNRAQWLGFDGAPLTQTLSINAPIINKNIGLGFSILNDKIGFVNKTYLFADFAYKIKLNNNAWLSFGVKAGVNHRKANFSGMNLETAADPDFAQNLISDWLPNFGAGIYYYTNKYYIGISIPKILENSYNINSASTLADLGGEQKHYFFIAGYLFDLSDTWKFKPTTYIKITKAAPIQIDLSTQFIYNDKFWLGSMFRGGDAIGILAGFYLNQQLSFGYSYDWSFANRTFKYNSGSHEVFLKYDGIFSNTKEIISPRYF
ncbi:MAG: type IX secretion system membrane protein PorP/SprF [Bacteroidales bacterium]|nr:type IX secretion system membrane protein PorP/SprF [Bacteroidales bacterium]